MPELSPSERHAIVSALHAHPARLVLVVAGGGNAIITDLLDVPGASRTVLEAVVPYSETAMADFVGRTPAEITGTGFVSASHAGVMANAARDRALELARDIAATDVWGLAVTAALVTDRTKRGDHRAHLALAGASELVEHRVDLLKGDLDRTGEDRTVADAALGVLARRFGPADLTISGQR